MLTVIEVLLEVAHALGYEVMRQRLARTIHGGAFIKFSPMEMSPVLELPTGKGLVVK